MRNTLLIFLFFLIASSSYAGQVDKSSPDNKKSLVVEQEHTNSSYLSPELTGAIFGALSAGFVTLMIKFGEWFFKRRTLDRILRKGLYFEIEHHRIVDLQKDQDNQPNFAIANFNDNFYLSNLPNISKIFNENLMQQLTFYYSHLKSAYEFQNDLTKINEKIYEIKSVEITDEKRRLLKEKHDLKETIRLILAIAQFARNNLRTELKKTFKEDPTKSTFIDVLPEHKKWFESIQKGTDKDK